MKNTNKKERESTPPPSYPSGRNYKEHPKFYTKDVFFQASGTPIHGDDVMIIDFSSKISSMAPFTSSQHITLGIL